MAYIRTPFGSSGDRTAIPNDAQPDGSVSYVEGFPIDYQLDPDSDPDAKNVPRDKFNELMYQAMVAVQALQQLGFPAHITAAANGGSAYSYLANATVRATDGNNYYSLIDGNTDVPPSANWGLVTYSTSQFVTGDTLPWMFSTLRTGGWLWMNGTTIGSAASGATQRANADTLALYTLLWTDFTNAVLPIQDSSGVASTRGLSAAADFAANKRLPVPDARGRTLFGRDNMGGAATAGRITNAKSGISGVTLGATGGLETVQLTSNQNGQHTHVANVTDPGHTHQVQGLSNGQTGQAGTFIDIGNTGFNAITSSTTGVTVTNANSGLGEDHQNMPPTLIASGWILKI